MGERDRSGSYGLERATQIVLENLLYAQRHPELLAEIAKRLGITEDTALAVTIADQLCEEFELVAR